MKKTGATLAVHVLEELGVEHALGIPGVHNTELYDAPARLTRSTRSSSFTRAEARSWPPASQYLSMEPDAEIEPVLEETRSVATSGQRVIVDVKIDCRRPQMTKGVVKTNLSHFSTSQKIRCRPRGQAAPVG